MVSSKIDEDGHARIMVSNDIDSEAGDDEGQQHFHG